MNLEITGTVNFECANTDIAHVGNIVSEKLIGEMNQLDGLEEYIRDEVPTIYSKDILGLRIILMQNPEDKTQFQIEVLDRMNLIINNDTQEYKDVDISDRILELLKGCSEFVFE